MTQVTAQPPVLSLNSVTFTYRDGTRALRDISLDIQANESFVLFGPSRSGKSTLLRLLNRLSDLIDGSQVEGEICFRGQNIFDRSVDLFALRRRISMVFAIPSPLPGSIRDNLTYGLRMAGVRDGKFLQRQVERSLSMVGLFDEVKDRLDTSAMALSGGQQQRLCLARSLALEPEIILLDNPTSGLDPLSTAVVEDTLRTLRDEFTIVMVPHSVQQAARVADRAGFLLDGELVEVGTERDLFLNPRDQRTEDYITGRYG